MFGLRGHGARRGSTCVERFHRFEALEQRIALSATPPTVANVAVASTQWSSAFITYLQDNSLGSGGYSIPVGSSAQGTALPWNNLDQIKISFSEDVDVQAADLSMTGVSTTSYAFSNFFYDPQSKTATWTLSAPFAKDRLLLDLDANGIDPIRDIDGNVLDGEWVNQSDTYATSGNGTAGGDFEFLFNVLPGEVNATTQVTNTDYVYVRSQDGKNTSSAGYNFKYDVDGSSTINSTDWQFVQGKIGNSLPSGSPAGTSNDAPTALPFSAVSISDAAADTAISLWGHFDDYENDSTGLTYSLAANTAASLFDAVSVNSSTGQLVLNAKSNVSGIAKITVTATDSGGITTYSAISVGVNHVNSPPSILSPTIEYLAANMWRVSGTVSDDTDPTGLIVVLFNTFDARAAVYPDGTFQVVATLPPDTAGDEFMTVADQFGEQSNVAMVSVGI